MGTPSSLKVYRILRGLSQAELADRAHLYQQRISLIELGSAPAQTEVERLSEALDVPASKLFPERFRK